MDVRRDYRVTVALSWFKRNFPCDEVGELYSEAGSCVLAIYHGFFYEFQL